MDKRLRFISPLLLVVLLVQDFIFADGFSHHVRHYKNRFKRQHGENLYLPASYVMLEENPEPDAGPWSDWSAPSACSRSCGGGVATQYRACLNGYPCRGSTQRYFSCNTQDCPDNEDYRAQQCAEFNDIHFEGETHNWIPYTKAPNQCELNCMPQGERFYYRHKKSVVDGTLCNDESIDVCVQGKCQPVGCDHMLGSNAREDKCRVCGGDGSNCNTVHNRMDLQDLQKGYNDVILIPMGATNIDIRERSPSNNYLAVRNQSGHYYLNGNWRIDFPKTLDFAGCKFHYGRYPQAFSAPDTLTCLGPTTETLVIDLLLQDVNVGIDYEYSMPGNIVSSPQNETYVWTYDQFSQCSSSCGGGIQYRNVSCAGRVTLDKVDPSLCDPSNRPADRQQCGDQPCDATWITKPWEKCSAPCGVGGTQTRQVVCERVIVDGVASIVDDSQCNNVQKPDTEQPCNQGEVCAEWHTGPWKPCDHLCGGGKETRVITCYREVKGKKEKLDDAQCSDGKPESERICNQRPCEGVDWVTSDWTGCEKCGLTSESRRVQCSTASGDVQPEELCKADEKPEMERECKTQMKECEYEWYASQWSDCSAKCGKGVRTRRVFCASVEDFTKADDAKCNEAVKYNASQECAGEKESCSGEWFSGPWSKCSKECGGGEMTRKVICMRDDETVEVTECGPDLIPSGSEQCNTHACDMDEVLPVDVTKPVDVTDDKEGPVSVVTDTGTKETSQGRSEGTTESGVSMTTEDDFEIVETDDCDDGEWIDDEEDYDEDEEKEGTKATDSSDLTESTLFGSSTAVSGASTESSLATEDLMMSDGTSSDMSDDTESTAMLETDFTDTGSGFSEETEETRVSGASEATEEGSGSDETLVSSMSTDSATSEGTESGVTTEEQTGSTYSISGSTDSSSGVTETSQTSESGQTAESGQTTGSDQTTESGQTSESGRTTESDVTTSGSDASSESVAFTSEVSSESTEMSSEITSDQTSDNSESTDSTETVTTDTTESTESTETTGSTESTESSGTSESPETTETTSDGSTLTEIESTTESDVSTAVSDSTTEEEVDIEADNSPDATTKKSSDSSTDATDSTTEFTGSTVSSIEFTQTSIASSESTDSASSDVTESTEITETTEISGSTEFSASEVSVTTESTGSTETSGSSEISGSTETASDALGSSTEISISTEFSESTQSTAEVSGSTDITASTELDTGSTEVDIWSSTTEGTTLWTVTEITEEIFTPRLRKCRRKKRIQCKLTQYGCCPDKITAADGPFDKGCPMPKTCKESKFGCCEDGVSAALGKNFKGCPPTHCEESLFGCCPDKKTPAGGNNKEGCPPPPPKCLKTKFGCCKDNVTKAKGPNFKGCKDKVDCSSTKFGCCPDGKNAAEGEYYMGCDINCKESRNGCCPDGVSQAEGINFMGCQTACANSTFGCCEDGITPAHGYSREGCCLQTSYGCCPDNINPAQGTNLEGCGCEYSPYRCCPDNVTPAQGHNYEGCGCNYNPNGCCPDGQTPAEGPEYQGCGCHTYQFGCCQDGVTVAKGPREQGCSCTNSEFGCCPDNITLAEGPNAEGCGCVYSAFGCCLDGVTDAQGENFAGCEEQLENKQSGCGQHAEPGPCRNFTVKWYYDVDYGGCNRFYYGGCEGNANRFRTSEECSATCVEPTGQDKCKLPKVAGSCDRYYPQWYYDKDHNHCAQFIWGGCLGNNNRFETSEECIRECVIDDSADACGQPKVEGPCRGQYLKWYYNNESSRCEQFYYGGCQGNKNNFLTEQACNQKCSAPNRQKEHCSQPEAQGKCEGREARWYYSGAEKRCMPFYYTGCDGNRNNFLSKELCEADCPREIHKDLCHLPSEMGDCADYTERWYFDTAERNCRQFYYGGCGGNGNNFASEQECFGRCSRPSTPAPPEPRPEQPQYPDQPQQPQETNKCFLPIDSGPCRNDSQPRWYYTREGVCEQFMYGGCEGNGNNFLTEEECRQNCDASQDLCSLPKVQGPCSGTYPQYFYDRQSNSCQQFMFGGCLGNPNRFDDLESCEQRCMPTSRRPVTEAPQDQNTPVCYQLVDRGYCNESIASYYFNIDSRQCETFTYSGCGGNANRYTSIEQCERQCGVFRGQDVCSLHPDAGPCRAFIRKFYFDRNSRTCNEFGYGGCEGNGNRFSSNEECEEVCIIREEIKPNRTSAEVCRLPVAVGNCNEGLKRWYFDDERGECIGFVYTGCGGNFNQFTSFQDCVNTCHDLLRPTNEIEQPSTDCDRQHEVCRSLQCPYGVKAHVDATGCSSCSCYDPCSLVDCSNGTQCGIDVNDRRQTEEDPTFIAVCRQVDKPGVCPQLQPRSYDDCARFEDCRTDADCTLDLKCCSTGGCGTSCVVPHSDSPAEQHSTPRSQAAYTQLPVQAGYYAPSLDQEAYQPEVNAHEGDFATLSCAVRGNPHPNITWSKENIIIDGKLPRYRLMLDGNLQIITLHRTDSGIYLCTADNQLGPPVTNQIELNVKDGIPFAAKMLDVPDEDRNVVVSLGSPAQLNCYALGYPYPNVAWWRDNSMIPLKTNQYEQRPDFSLLIHKVELSDLGVYTCQTYNGLGKAASWSVTVQTHGPVYTTNEDEKKYMKYVIEPQRYEPARSHYPTPQPAYGPVPVHYTEPPRFYQVPVKVRVNPSDATVNFGHDVGISCEVDGYPVPRVDWYKDDQRIDRDDYHVEITETHRLIIKNASAADAGIYRCEASNSLSQESGYATLSVNDGPYIPKNCTDNPYLAKCELIVHNNLCNHKFYSRFCCKSCAKAGKLSFVATPDDSYDENRL